MKINRKFTRIMGVGLSTAMVASSLVTAVPAFAITTPVVSVSPTTISTNATYNIQTSLQGMVLNGGNITVNFPAGTSIQSGDIAAHVTVIGGTGFNGAAFAPANFGGANITGTSSTTNPRIVIALTGAGNEIGQGADLVIVVGPGAVSNPSNPGSYTLNISTSNETTQVASNAYTITLPTFPEFPGTVVGRNAGGQIIAQAITNDINSIIAVANVRTVEIGAGTYNLTVTASVAGQTITGTPGAKIAPDTIGANALVVTAANVTISGLSLNISTGAPSATQNNTLVSGNNSRFTNVTFIGGATLLGVDVAGASPLTTIENCVFGVTGNVTRGLQSFTTTRVTNSVFNVDASGTGIAASGNLTLTGSNFTGAAGTGTGISINASTSTISNSTFSGLGNAALEVTGGDATVRDCSITGNGASSASSTSGVVRSTGGMLLLINNTISNSAAANYALHVSGGVVTARFNNITGNTLNVRQTGGTANASLNWWGSSTGPVASSLNATTAANLVTTPFLTGTVTGGTLTFGTSNLTARAMAGVDVSTSNGTVAFASAARYAANPQTTTPVGSPIAYFDVALGVTPGVEPGSITIRFYGNVTENTRVYYGGGISGAWSLADTQGVNTANGFAFITITGTSAPSFSDMGGTPFVITNVAPALTAPALLGPVAGATGVPLNTGFSWSTVAGAVTYNFQVSTVPTFATTVASQTGLTSTVSGGVALAANTTYFWRVQAVNAGGTGAYATGTFTTISAAAASTTPPAVTVNVTPTAPVINVAPAAVTVQPPNVTVNPPQVTVTAPPPAQVTVNPPQVTVTAPPPADVTVNIPDAQPLIPAYILWTIILIGAVLVIALIVLIVRTRRVA